MEWESEISFAGSPLADYLKSVNFDAEEIDAPNILSRPQISVFSRFVRHCVAFLGSNRVLRSVIDTVEIVCELHLATSLNSLRGRKKELRTDSFGVSVLRYSSYLVFIAISLLFSKWYFVCAVLCVCAASEGVQLCVSSPVLFFGSLSFSYRLCSALSYQLQALYAVHSFEQKFLTVVAQLLSTWAAFEQALDAALRTVLEVDLVARGFRLDPRAVPVLRRAETLDCCTKLRRCIRAAAVEVIAEADRMCGALHPLHRTDAGLVGDAQTQDLQTLRSLVSVVKETRASVFIGLCGLDGSLAEIPRLWTFWGHASRCSALLRQHTLRVVSTARPLPAAAEMNDDSEIPVSPQQQAFLANTSAILAQLLGQIRSIDARLFMFGDAVARQGENEAARSDLEALVSFIGDGLDTAQSLHASLRALVCPAERSVRQSDGTVAAPAESAQESEGEDSMTFASATLPEEPQRELVFEVDLSSSDSEEERRRRRTKRKTVNVLQEVQMFSVPPAYQLVDELRSVLDRRREDAERE